MDQALTNAQIILKILEPFKTWRTPYANVNYEILTDPTQQHFQVVVSGWDGQKRVHTMLVHIAIRNNLIWLEDCSKTSVCQNTIFETIFKPSWCAAQRRECMVNPSSGVFTFPNSNRPDKTLIANHDVQNDQMQTVFFVEERQRQFFELICFLEGGHIND